MTDAAELLAAYDTELRGAPEVREAIVVRRIGPAWVAVMPSGRGFITTGADPRADFAALVPEALAFVLADPTVRSVEWKTRAHDAAPGLLEALAAVGFAPDEPESIMIGAAELLAVDVPVPEGVQVLQAVEEADVRRAGALADLEFDGAVSPSRGDALVRRVAAGSAVVWYAQLGGEVVCSGRLDPVDGTAFAGIWGGVTREDLRRRGIYRAVTAARARSAIALGKRYVQSDSTEYSRPILERAGFTKVSETTPWVYSVAGGRG